jgi:signal peptidase II
MKNSYLKNISLFLMLSAIIVLIDQLLKKLVENKLGIGESIVLLKNVFAITLNHNSGMAFGLFSGQYTFSLWIALIVVGLVVYYYDETENNVQRTSLILILGGTIGNFIDRISYGYVIDYVQVSSFPIFNLADAALCIGVALLIIGYWKSEKKMQKSC